MNLASLGRAALLGLALPGALLVLSPAARARDGDSFCREPRATPIPARPADAPTGSAFGAGLAATDDEAREALIRQELLEGNIPQFLRRLQPVELHATLGARALRIVLCVMPDYLAVGSDRDYLLVPLRLQTALAVADRYGFALPTDAVVDAIYAQSAVHLAPQPLPASAQMRSTRYYLTHDAMVREQRAGFEETPGALVAGDKKDLVLTSLLWSYPERVAIYGWHTRDARPIQPLSIVHGWHYVDYSHGTRLLSRRILVNGAPADLYSALEDPALAPLLNHHGAIARVADLVARLGAPHADHISASLLR